MTHICECWGQSPSKRTEYCAISTETLNNYLEVQTFREVQIKYSGKGYQVVFWNFIQVKHAELAVSSECSLNSLQHSRLLEPFILKAASMLLQTLANWWGAWKYILQREEMWHFFERITFTWWNIQFVTLSKTATRQPRAETNIWEHLSSQQKMIRLFNYANWTEANI